MIISGDMTLSQGVWGKIIIWFMLPCIFSFEILFVLNWLWQFILLRKHFFHGPDTIDVTFILSVPKEKCIHKCIRYCTWTLTGGSCFFLRWISGPSPQQTSFVLRRFKLMRLDGRLRSSSVTVYLRSLTPLNIISYYIKWVKTSWTYNCPIYG